MPFLIGFILLVLLLAWTTIRRDKKEKTQSGQLDRLNIDFSRPRPKPEPAEISVPAPEAVPKPPMMSWSAFLKKHSGAYVAFDLETTGLSPANDAIIEIGAVKVENGEVSSAFSTFVNPQRHIPEAATAVNHITDQMVADAPGLPEALADFQAFVGDLPCVAHNCPFDSGFLAAAGMAPLPPFADTLPMARNLLPGLVNYKLSTVSYAVHHDVSNAHRALDDAQAVHAIVRACAALRSENESGKKALERHNKLTVAIHQTYDVARTSEEGKDQQLDGVIAMCREDFTLVEPVRAYCRRFQYPDPVFDSFRRAIIILSRQRKYDQAVEVCQLAIALGVDDPGYNGGMQGRLEKLKGKIQ